MTKAEVLPCACGTDLSMSSRIFCRLPLKRWKTACTAPSRSLLESLRCEQGAEGARQRVSESGDQGSELTAITLYALFCGAAGQRQASRCSPLARLA